MTAPLNAVKIATFNVVSLISFKRKNWLLDLLNNENIDIALLQETKLSSLEDSQNFVRLFGHKFWCFHTLTSARVGSTAILIRKNPSLKIVDCELAENGRFCLVDVLVGSELVRFACVYAPNETTDRSDLFTALRAYLCVSGTVFLGGDFNCVLRANDRAGRDGGADASSRVLSAVLRDSDLSDVALGRSWPTKRYTRWQGTSHAHLDRIYVSGDGVTRVSDYTVTPISFSDHGLVTCTVALNTYTGRQNPSTRWLMNSTVLKNETFVEKTQKEIEALRSGTLSVEKWGTFKARIKRFAITIGREEAALKKEKKGPPLGDSLRAH